MSLRSAVVIVVDRWGSAYLGPYGNTWLDTPAINSFASRSLLCETVLAESPLLADAYRSYWTARHVLQPPAGQTFVAQAAQRGVQTVLVSDEAQVARHTLAADFDRVVFTGQPAADRCASEASQTGLSRGFETAAETLAELAPPYLLWIHVQGLSGPWDAPREFREQFRDEEDPDAGDFAAPPELRMDKQFDPDELLKLAHAYAGQVSLLDHQLAAFLELIVARNEPQTLIALTSPRGYPLGEHGRIGPCDEALYGELLQVPLLMQFPQTANLSARTQELVQPHDLGAALAAHFELSPRDQSALWQIADNNLRSSREVAVAIGHEQRAIRTPGWFLRESLIGGAAQHELFAKPDDRFEVNEVSSRCSQEVELLISELDRYQQVASNGLLAELAPLPEILRNVWR